MSMTTEGYEDNYERIHTRYKCLECREEFDEGDMTHYQSLAGVCPYCGSREIEAEREEC